jgi:hypothetical protein
VSQAALLALPRPALPACRTAGLTACLIMLPPDLRLTHAPSCCCGCPLHACRIPSTTGQTDSGRSKEKEEEEGSAAALADLFNGAGAALPALPARLPACWFAEYGQLSLPGNGVSLFTVTVACSPPLCCRGDCLSQHPHRRAPPAHRRRGALHPAAR